jgi:glycine oxidase
VNGSDVVVLGGGIIGLAIAWQLARRGAHVTVLERDAPGHAASWAAAGMLAPYTEVIDDLPLREFAIASLRAYPAFAQELLLASDVDIYLRLHGILEVAYDASHADRLRARVASAQANGVTMQLLSESEIAGYEGALAAQAHCAVLSPEEGQVDNRRLGRALTEAAVRAGVRIRRNCSALAVECSPRRIMGVRTDEGYLSAGYVVNALGAWAGEVSGLPAHYAVPVRPVKGQMLAVAMPRRYIERVVWAAGVYLVPRDDGRLLVGATVEECGFDDRLTAGGVHTLLSGLLAALPGAANFAVSETWTGVRPNTPDGRPYVGASELGGYIVASGHYRNGVLLTPITSLHIADALEGKAQIDPAFSPQRGSLALS